MKEKEIREIIQEVFQKKEWNMDDDKQYKHLTKNDKEGIIFMEEVLKEFEKEGLILEKVEDDIYIFKTTGCSGYKLYINRKFKEIFPEEDCASTLEELPLIIKLFEVWENDK